VSDAPLVVLGATGFVGRALTAHAAAAGRRVVAHGSATCDLRDPASVRAVLGGLGPDADVVVTSAIRRTLDDSFEAFLDNVRMAENVAAAVPESGLHGVVFLSSVDVYGRPPSTLPVSERSPLRPTSHYGVAKVASEQLLGLLDSGRAPCTILRLPGVYGGADDDRSVVAQLVRRVAAGEPVRLAGDGSTLRDYAHVDDVVALAEAAVARPRAVTVNVATGASVTLRAIVETAAGALGVEPEIVLDPSAATGGDLVFDVSALHEAFPEVSLRSVEAGVRELADAL
jgi:UDP-glucose 4-epimerase